MKSCSHCKGRLQLANTGSLMYPNASGKPVIQHEIPLYTPPYLYVKKTGHAPQGSLIVTRDYCFTCSRTEEVVFGGMGCDGQAEWLSEYERRLL